MFFIFLIATKASETICYSASQNCQWPLKSGENSIIKTTYQTQVCHFCSQKAPKRKATFFKQGPSL